MTFGRSVTYMSADRPLVATGAARRRSGLECAAGGGALERGDLTSQAAAGRGRVAAAASLGGALAADAARGAAQAARAGARSAASASPCSAAAWPGWPRRTSWSSAASRSTSTSARRWAARRAASRSRAPRRGGRRALPGEHGFRFFPGFYHHVPDTMRRIPFARERQRRLGQPRRRRRRRSRRAPSGRADGTVFGIAPDPQRGAHARRACAGSSMDEPQRPRRAAARARLLRRARCWSSSPAATSAASASGSTSAGGTSSRPRASPRSTRRSLARGLTRDARRRQGAQVASTRTIGNMAEAFVYNIMGRGNDGAPDRVLNAPTNEAWIDPWVALPAQARRALPRRPRRSRRSTCAGGRIAAARARDRRGRRRRDRGRLVRLARCRPSARASCGRADVLALDPRARRRWTSCSSTG